MVEPIRRADMKALVSRKPQRLALKWLSQVYEVLLPWLDLKVLHSEDVLHEVNKHLQSTNLYRLPTFAYL